MRRYLWLQVRHRSTRAVTLGAGILVAAVSFSLLTSAARTSALELRGTVRAHFRSAYDVLVRPTGDPSSAAKPGPLPNNFESGIFGGITMAQWRRVLSTPGVQVAAPVENLGFIVTATEAQIPVGPYLSGLRDQLYRLRLTWVADRGLSRYPGEVDYVYVTDLPTSCQSLYVNARDSFSSPFDSIGPAYSTLECYSPAARGQGVKASSVVLHTRVYFPILIAAVDPVQENKLLPLNRTIVQGVPLAASDTYSVGQFGSVVPVVASAKTYVDESLNVAVERVPIPSDTTGAALLHGNNRPGPAPATYQPGPNDAYRRVRQLPGKLLGRETFGPEQLYASALHQMESNLIDQSLISTYWTTSPVSYRQLPGGGLGVRTVSRDPLADFGGGDQYGGFTLVPPGNNDTQFRRLAVHPVKLNAIGAGKSQLSIQGEFDPTRLPGFDPLSKVPLESYYPPLAEPADAASRRALHNQPLAPSTNLGGYLASPPFMLTTLQAAWGLTDPRFFSGANSAAPISVIRVRVAGVTGPDKASLARIKQVATLIRQRTGLTVDVTAGSSPSPQLIELPAGHFGRPALLLREGWVKKGVAVVVLAAVDKKSLLLFGLVLLVTGLFLANAALSSVRSRRGEIGTLLALGWRPRRIFLSIVGELALIGLLAGLAGSAIAAALVAALSLRLAVVHTLLVTPVAVALPVAAGLVPRSSPPAVYRSTWSAQRWWGTCPAATCADSLEWPVPTSVACPGVPLLPLSRCSSVSPRWPPWWPSTRPLSVACRAACSGTSSRCRPAAWTISPSPSPSFSPVSRSPTSSCSDCGSGRPNWSRCTRRDGPRDTWPGSSRWRASASAWSAACPAASSAS